MYHYIDDKEFLKNMRSFCSDIVNQLVQRINNDSIMTAKAHLVGSGAKKLITQNANEPIDLDYNLYDMKEARTLSRYADTAQTTKRKAILDIFGNIWYNYR